MSDASKYMLIQQVKSGKLPVSFHSGAAEAVFVEPPRIKEFTLEEKEEKLIESLLELLKSEFKI